ncbi:COG4315 family predicted lipoprotein [Sinosporangium siamense]|uniref:Lipoprotein with Yx(FWY)xxD motif n=1 Tax=Sinosporangium siamense TaxID=1367973 RepID=A0A919RKE9_9ACTN|nr:hypothetical protein [Sinosporangium siamense]GII95452.1 hypothetical protein Ssi02_56830 [Sinosporangium siamense]
MRRTWPVGPAATAALLGLGLTLTACGSNSTQATGMSTSAPSRDAVMPISTRSAAPAPDTPTPSATPAAAALNAVGVETTRFGTILTGPRGHTLYAFERDNAGAPTCAKACAKDWPPFLTTGKPEASGAVNPNMLGVIERKNGKKQVTYNGHPLYLNARDSAPGETKGQDLTAFGAQWHVVGTDGKKILD